MHIDDDADTATVINQTVAAIREAAAHIGKADRRFDADQIRQVEDAVRLLQGMLNFKKRK
jgi:hypothetical protein